ncbi:superoxide dismutase [Benzoatithermus flavus]|uniref:Superoxide dismutase n=1 Tax=Benzoatithermus flavus TaxID=3108223 RepID=A0ABU8XVL2_9PROT
MAFQLPDLPYDYEALAPYMSSKTLHLHHDKHHQTYVTNLNNLIEGTEFASKSLEEIVTGSYGDPAKQGIFNNAGQHWNHNLFWRIMKKGGGGAPGGELARRINDAFGSFEAFKEQFKTAAVTQFGSGWAWLALDGDTLKVMKTPNGENPLVHGMRPILGLDVWEHAYYLDYENRRPEYVAAFLNNLVNWDEVEAELHKALA